MLCIIFFLAVLFICLFLCRSFVAGGHKFVFMVRGPLMFVAVSQGPEYQQQIIQQMTYAYNQILSVLTFTQLQTVFQRKPNFDLRFLLQGTYVTMELRMNTINLLHFSSFCRNVICHMHTSFRVYKLQGCHKSIVFVRIPSPSKICRFYECSMLYM